MSYASIPAQQSMALDKTRHKIYELALKEAIIPESVVLDLGDMLGIFGLLAARWGAKKFIWSSHNYLFVRSVMLCAITVMRIGWSKFRCVSSETYCTLYRRVRSAESVPELRYLRTL